MASQQNRVAPIPIKQNFDAMTSRMKDFTWINPLEFHGLMFEKDPQEFFNKVY